MKTYHGEDITIRLASGEERETELKAARAATLPLL